jgi:hypothetical protein
MELIAHRCDKRLLALGYGARLLWLDPVFAVLSDTAGTAWLTPNDLAAAQPDPFCHLEHDWLRHLDQDHSTLLHAFSRQASVAPRGVRTRVRPFGVDRLGLRLRIEDSGQEQDLRLPFQRPATTPAQLAIELHRLAKCQLQ